MTEQKEHPLNTLISGLPYEGYASFCTGQRALRSSYFKHLRKSARHLKAALDKPEEPSDAMTFGNLVHSLFENPWRFMDLHVVEPIFEGPTLDGKMSTRSKAALEAKKAWHEKIPKEAIVVTQKDADRIYGIWNTLKEKKLITGLLKDGIKEQSLVTKDPETGGMLACRPDFVTIHGHVIDLKTARDAGPEHFLQQIFSYRQTSPFYLLQASHYTHCLKSAGIGDGKSFLFIAMESTAPFEMRCYPLDEGALDAGDGWRKKLTRIYADCLMSDKWPGYDDTAYPVGVPSWFDDPPSIGEELE